LWAANFLRKRETMNRGRWPTNREPGTVTGTVN
jgi:hypothetical protein